MLKVKIIYPELDQTSLVILSLLKKIYWKTNSKTQK